MLGYVWLIPLLPLLGAFALGVAGRRWSNRTVSLVGVGSAGLSFAVALAVARTFFLSDPASFPLVQHYFEWIQAGAFQIRLTFYLDQLSLLMVLVVTGVGFLIHLYSIGYMAHEGGFYRFFAYMNLFMFFMLLLVLAGNYLVLFVGWEGVGLCSYLLIGFFFLRDSAAAAGKKAFLVNRIGDYGFTLAVLLIFTTFHSLDFATVFERAQAMPAEGFGQMGVLTGISLLLLCGAVGKSAQVPLYVWLPDAMEGPTPVSALIHAATMVAAGVYMVARAHVLFSASPTTLAAVAGIGCLTAFYAATIGLVQTDIKRVLAYSTVSQLGYMFLGLGVGAYAAGIFHLMTHAFFKALLFLAAGSVVHALGGEQDIRNMGGLRRRIPITYWTFVVATLAITGIPGFSGFFSKDEVLWQTFSSPSGNKLLWFVGVSATALTAFYMFRLLFLAFHGDPRYTDVTAERIHESPRVMTRPLLALAFLSLAGGWVGIPAAIGGANRIEHFLAPVFASSTERLKLLAGAHTHTEQIEVMMITIVLVAAGLGIAYWVYLGRPGLAKELAQSFHAPYQVLLNKYYVDELYQKLVVRPVHWVADQILWQLVDVAVIDGAVNGVGVRARSAGGWLRAWQSGNMRSYAGWVVLGALAIVTYLVWVLR
ncbi:MAG: NADH-quinone oxidoreductase subunit L [Acidobacteria bacterium]|nr:NADH-quinone oxidoreductase subunit L [Acidobacteriota bacterium]